MARPGSEPVWATNANYLAGPAVGTPTVVAPSGPVQAEGWEPGQKPGAQNQNWWQNLVYQWIHWLQAGVLDGAWEFTGNVKIDGNLEVDGTFTTSRSITLPCHPVNSFETTIHTVPLGALGQSGSKAGWTLGSDGSKFVYYAVTGLRAGDTITGYAMTLRKINAGTTIASHFVTSTNSGDAVSAGDSQSGGVGTYNLGPSDALALVYSAAAAYYIKITPGGTAGDAIDTVTCTVTRTAIP